MSKPALSIGFDVPFDEAIAWAKSQITVLPDTFYNVLPAQARSRARTVSGLASLDQIQGVLDSLTRVLETGETFAGWQKTLAPEALALGQARLDNIFRTNIQTHYNIGRYQQQEANKAHRPFRMWDAINDGRTRPHHKAMDNYIAPLDDPIWKKWSAPAGFRCRCSTLTLTEAQARQRGWNGAPKALPGDVQPDKGWDYDKLTGQDAALKRVTSEMLGRITDAILKAKAVEVLDNAVMESKGKGIDGSVGIDKRLLAALSKNEGDARAYVLGNGRRTGFEYIYAFDAVSGKVLARHTDNLTDGVGMPPNLVSLASDKSNHIIVYHNHPNSLPPSAADLAAIGKFPGVESGAINGHDDSWYKITPIERGNIVPAIKCADAIVRDFAMLSLTRLIASERAFVINAARLVAFKRIGYIGFSSNVSATDHALAEEVESLAKLIYALLVRQRG